MNTQFAGDLQIVLIANPKSGSGKGLVVRDRFCVALREAGLNPIERSPFDSNLDLNPQTVAVVLGGDGTILHLLPRLVSSGAMVYPVPVGNENLFARDLGPTEDPGLFVQALQSRSIREIGVGAAAVEGGEFRFVSHLSVGFDSVVLSDVNEHRVSTITNGDYVRGVIRTLIGGANSEIVVRDAHGEQVAAGRGIFVVGNTGSYARGLAPVPESDPTAELLAGRFFPTDGVIPVASLLYHLAVQTPLETSSLPLIQSAEFVIEGGENPIPVQADGEIIGVTPVRVTRGEGRLRILEIPAK